MVETKNTEEEIRIFVAVCQWGINIAEIVDCSTLAEFAKTLPNVVAASDYISLCTESHVKQHS